MSDRLCPLSEAARDAPHHPAILAKGLSLTFSELDRQAAVYTAELQKLKIQPGNRIAIRHAADWRMIAFFFAVWRCRASLCPLNLRLPSAQIETCLSRLSPSLFLTDLSLPFSSPLSSACDTPFLLLFTSGSTGTPKIAALSQANLLANAEPAVSALDLRPNDQWLLSLPLFHVGGIGILLRCILARAAIVLDERIPTITHLSYVPAQLYRSWPVYKNLRCLLLGGAPLPSCPSSLPIYPTYGLTEMGSIVFIGSPRKSLLSGRELRIAPDGEILLRGACLFQGYWEEGKLHLPVDENGWFATRDIGCYSEKEGLAIIGRKDWQFISGGENIQPEEIEKELLLLPEVEEAVVVPVNDPEFGQRPAAAVRSNDPRFDLRQLQARLSAKLPKYKLPVVLILLEEIPKTGIKIDRKRILELFK